MASSITSTLGTKCKQSKYHSQLLKFNPKNHFLFSAPFCQQGSGCIILLIKQSSHSFLTIFYDIYENLGESFTFLKICLYRNSRNKMGKSMIFQDIHVGITLSESTELQHKRHPEQNQAPLYSKVYEVIYLLTNFKRIQNMYDLNAKILAFFTIFRRVSFFQEFHRNFKRCGIL